MTKEKAFVIGDIHGMYHSLEVMLSHWRRDEEQLILVGDYIDRGPNSDSVLKTVRTLQKEHNAILLRGNHEQLFLNYLLEPRKEWKLYKQNGGATTISQLLQIQIEDVEAQAPEEVVEKLLEKEPWLIEWLESLVYYTTFGNHIIVHAGVDFTKSDWRYTSLHDFLWIREGFHYEENTTGRNIIFGHTPVQTLHESVEPWQRDGKWGIDGGNVYGGSLIALRIDREEVNDVVVLR